MATRAPRTRRSQSFLRRTERILGESILLVDTSITRVPAAALARSNSRDPGREAHIATLFIERNRETLVHFGVDVRIDYDGSNVSILFRTSSIVGAFALISPLSGKTEISVVVRPRFGWSGLGSSLAVSGFKVTPKVFDGTLLPKTERDMPAWVLSATILAKLEPLIRKLARRFEMADEISSVPRGAVNWTEYATQKVAGAKFLEVPCRHPELRTNTELRAAIHFTLQKQLRSLETQTHAGEVVLRLIQRYRDLLHHVNDVVPRAPGQRQIEFWLRTPLATEAFVDGLTAIKWTADDTGLGGMTDWRGLPWSMSMEQFFEAWVESLFELYTRRFGGVLKAGRKRQTITPIAWDRPYLGSQKYLLPDLVIESDSRVIFVDAKYKGHWEELSETRWMNLDVELRERHREDLLQVLAYSSLTDARFTTACLVYPCSIQLWDALRQRDQLHHRGSIYAGTRRVEVILTAVPMGLQPDLLVGHLGSALVGLADN